MLLSKYKTVYLHPPKTAGNAIQSVLIRHSDDEISVSGHQDGLDRFEVIGKETPRKHTTLAEYESILGEKLVDYKVAISVRHPFDRALSMYFSPHRWFRKDGESFVATEPRWDHYAFEAVANDMVSMADFIRLDGKPRAPHFIIKFENLAQSFSTFITQAGIPCSNTKLELRNKSASQDNEIESLRKSLDLRKMVEQKFSEDMSLFGY